MRYRLKGIVVWVLHAFTWIFALPAVMEHRLTGQERFFDFFAKALSLIPGYPGQYLRASYYRLTLASSPYDLAVGFASFFSHMGAEVGRGVKIGSFSIIGTATLEEGVMIASRVSILSGKYHHGGGARGRDIERNAVVYEKVRIGARTWLGEGVIVMANVGKQCIVSAGSVITRPVPDGCTAVGNPARWVKYGDPAPRPIHAATA